MKFRVGDVIEHVRECGCYSLVVDEMHHVTIARCRAPKVAPMGTTFSFFEDGDGFYRLAYRAPVRRKKRRAK